MGRRKTEELERRLRDTHSARGPAGPPDDDVAPLVDTAQRLRGLSPLRRPPGGLDARGLRPAFRAGLRQRLDAEAESLAPARTAAVGAARQRVPAGGVPPAPRRRHFVLAGLVAITIALGTATSVASSAALPGDLLYPVKRSTEDARLLVTQGRADRGAAELDLARERLGESWRLAAADAEPDAAALEAVLTELRTTAATGVTVLLTDFEARGDPASLAEVQRFLVTAIPSMRDLYAMLPPGVRAVADDLVVEWVGVQRSVIEAVAVCGPGCADVLD